MWWEYLYEYIYMWGNIYVREYLCEVISMWGYIYVRQYLCEGISMCENIYLREYLCEGISMWGYIYVREYLCEEIFMWGNIYVRVYLCEGIFMWGNITMTLNECFIYDGVLARFSVLVYTMNQLVVLTDSASPFWWLDTVPWTTNNTTTARIGQCSTSANISGS